MQGRRVAIRRVSMVPVKSMTVILLLLVRCVPTFSRNHTVGGLSGWDFSSNLQLWSDSITFLTGDNLVFKYPPLHDVLEVSRVDFRVCRTIKPIITHNDGETVVPLTRSGTRYFICGRRGHCAMGLRLRVPVIAVQSAPAPANSSSGDSASGRPQSRSNGRKVHPPPSPLTGNNGHPPPQHTEFPHSSSSSSSTIEFKIMESVIMMGGCLVYSLISLV